MSKTSPRQTRRARRQHARTTSVKPRSRPRISLLQIAAVSVLAVAAVIGFVWLGNAQSTPPASTLPPTITQNGHVRGVASAPVTIEEWADFQCPACGQFARLTEPQLLSTYVAKGQVSLVFHHFAFLGQESSWAAEAAECAGEQGKFFEYHDKLYASQAGENRGAFSKDNLKKLATDLGLASSFNSCVDSGRYAQTVRDDTKVGEGRGVQATPTLFVNGRKIEGAATIEQLRTIIDPLLVGR
jgi:protein-disulfide isomerase